MNYMEVIARARSAIGKPTIYELSRGGFEPKRDHPADAKGRCDCSGFASWCLGISRHTDNPWYKEKNGEWIETSAIIRDCRSPFGFFDFSPMPMPGMLLVYGDHDGHQGHVGVISRVENGSPTLVIDCSQGSFDHYGDAIRERTPQVFLSHKAFVARPAWVEWPSA